MVFSIWLSAVLLAQVLPLPALVAMALLVLSRCNSEVRRRFVVLIRRSRWILVTLLMTFLLMTPGERLIADFPVSREGFSSGLEHVCRLLAVLLAVAWLVGGRSVEWLLSAMLGLLKVLHLNGGEPFVVRLALTLRYATGDLAKRSWRAMLAPSEEQDPGAANEIVLAHVPLSRVETMATGFAVLSACLLLLVAL